MAPRAAVPLRLSGCEPLAFGLFLLLRDRCCCVDACLTVSGQRAPALVEILRARVVVNKDRSGNNCGLEGWALHGKIQRYQ